MKWISFSDIYEIPKDDCFIIFYPKQDLENDKDSRNIIVILLKGNTEHKEDEFNYFKRYFTHWAAIEGPE